MRPAGELVPHLIERSRERSNFVAAAVRRTRGHVARAEPDRRLLQLLQTATCGAEYEQRDQCRADDEYGTGDERHGRRHLEDDHADWRTPEQDGYRTDWFAIDEHRGEFTETERRWSSRREAVVVGRPRNEHPSARRQLAPQHLAPECEANVIRNSARMVGHLASVNHQHDERLKDF